MNDDEMWERLRSDAKTVREEGDAIAVGRVMARVHERLAAADESVLVLLARWFRPVASMMAALAVVVGLAGVAYLNDTPTLDDVAMTSLLSEDFYRVID